VFGFWLLHTVHSSVNNLEFDNTVSSLLTCKGSVQLSLCLTECYAIKMYGNRSRSSNIPKLGIRCRRVVSFTLM